MPHARLALLLTVCLPLAVGCGGPPLVVVTGKLMYGDKPFQPDNPDDSLVLLFQGDGPDGVPQAHPAQVAADGAFTVGGPNQTGIPPGRYTIVVSTTSSGDDGSPRRKDRLRGRFESGKSPLTAEVTAARGQQFTIDLSKGTVTTP